LLGSQLNRMKRANACRLPKGEFMLVFAANRHRIVRCTICVQPPTERAARAGLAFG
jgi:hypothetical protein